MNSNVTEFNGKITKKTLQKVNLRSIPMEATWNYERQMHLGYCYAMLPALKEIYKDDKEALAEAMTRHMEFYNTTPFVITLPLGISIAMEEKNAEDENFETTSISTVKTALMGPIAGIGDAVYWGTLRVVATGIGTSLALQGNILGPILFLLIYNVPHFIIRYILTFTGYRMGTNFLTKLEESGLMDILTYGASVLGLSVAGAMTAEMVSINFNLPIGVGETATNLQAVLEGVIPGLFPLLFTGVVYWLLKKGVKPLPLTFLLMLFAVVGAWLGFLV